MALYNRRILSLERDRNSDDSKNLLFFQKKMSDTTSLVPILSKVKADVEYLFVLFFLQIAATRWSSRFIWRWGIRNELSYAALMTENKLFRLVGFRLVWLLGHSSVQVGLT